MTRPQTRHALAGRGLRPVLFFLGCLLKKLSLFTLLFFLAAPGAYAYDFGTAGIVAGLTGTGIALGMVFGAVPAIGTALIGAAVLGVTLDQNETAGSAVTVQLSSTAPLVTPAGWTPPVAPSSQPTPPSSSTLVQKFNLVGYAPNYQNYDSAAALCAARTPGGYASGGQCYSAGGGSAGTIQVVNTCSSGYSYSSGSCVLTDAAQVQKPSDGKCVITRSGNTFSTDPRDPDCSTKPATIAVTSNQVSQTRTDGTTKTVTINADGSVTVTETRPNQTTNTTETNTTQIAAPDASGIAKVAGQTSGSTNGTGTANTGAPVSTFDKSGLATESTQSGIASDISAIKDSLVPGTADTSLTAEKGALDGAMDAISGMFAGETAKEATGLTDDFSLGGYLPSQCGCTPLTMSFHGHTASYDWCAPMETFKGVLSWVLGILTALYVLSLFRLGGSK